MQQLQERKIEHVLQKLGLNQSETEIFLHGLKIGPATIIQIAKYSGFQRITTHAIVERLVKKGLFLETFSKKKRLVYPNTLDSLTKLLDKKKFEIQELEEEVKSAASILKSLQAQSERFPNVRFYKGKEGINIMTNEIIKDETNTFVISDAQHFYDLIDNEFLERSLKMRQHKNLTIQMVFPIGFEHFYYTQGTYQQQLDIKALPAEHLLKG